MPVGFADTDHWATTSIHAINFLENRKVWGLTYDEVSLDHDLGGDDTGMKVLEWIIETGFWPKVLTIHTANPPARDQMLRAANAEAPEGVDIFIRYW
jgi:hypothetical protein